MKLFPRPIRFIEFASLVVLAVCPLLFFTDLTRNPYQAQITLLHLTLLFIATWDWVRNVRHPSGHLELTLVEGAFLLFLGWAALASAWNWWTHPAFRPSMTNEALKGWLLIALNGYLAFRMGRVSARGIQTIRTDASIWPLFFLACFWGALWLPFHHFRSPDHPLWDPYGFFLWAFLLTLLFLRRRADEIWNAAQIILFVSIIAGAYGSLQYLGRDVIWSSLLNPYNGRPVSTFGNPNFLSSYLVMTLPLAAAMALATSNKRQSIGYILFFFLIGAGLLCTLTRTSWVGGLVGLCVFIVLARNFFDKRRSQIAAVIAAAICLIIIFWPKSPTSSLTLSPISRTRELFIVLRTGQTYQALHQRLLIWRTSWEMIRSHPVTGIGWGCFEIFYPFAQGPQLFNPRFRNLRTHANNAHSLVLELWSQTGTVGLGLFMGLLILLFLQALKGRRRLEPTGQLLAAGALGGGVGMLVDNLLGNVSLFFAVPAFLFWWLMGVVSGATESTILTLKPNPSFKRAFSVILLAGSALVIYHLCARFQGERLYFQGFKLSKEGKISQAIPYLEASNRAYPLEVNNAYELGNCYAREATILEASGQQGLVAAKRRKAIDAYKLALAANPGYDEIYYNLATMLAQEGRLEDAFENFEISLSINPLSRESAKALASLGSKLPDRRDQVIAGLQNAVYFYPDDLGFRTDLSAFQTNRP